MSLIIIVSIVWIASEVIIARTRICSGSDKSQDKFSLQILWITIAVSITAGVYLNKFEFGRIDSFSGYLYYMGIVLILLGLSIRWLAISKLKHLFTVHVSIHKDHKLVQDGLYKHIRHPAYLGSLLSFFGLGLSFSNGLSLVVIFVPILVAFIHRITIEERVLMEEFGDDYRRYSEKTSRVLPRLY